ncbi:MAG: BatA domain-containing protein [Pedobacter sp.]
MQLLSPLGLLALVSLVVPLLIHLWNVKEGKKLRIGSIALLGESSKLSSNSFRIKDWLLFVIRCLLLIMLTLTICDPYFSAKKDGPKEKGWVMIAAPRLKQVYTTNRKTIDSLLNKGYKIHNFGFGFDELSVEDTVKLFKPDTPLIQPISLVKQLNSILGNGFPVVLYAEKTVQTINEPLPPLRISLIWNSSATADQSKTTTIKYGERMYSAKLSPFYISFQRLPGVDTGVTHVSIFQESNSLDSKYLASAVQSIASYRGFKVELKYVRNVSRLSDADLIFWLSPENLSDKIIGSFKKQARIFAYATGKVASLNSFISLQDGSQVNDDPSLHKRIVGNNYLGATIWSDYQGTPLLTKESKGGHDLYKLYTRFDRSWTSLVWQDQLVRSLIPIVSPEVSAYQNFGYVNVSGDPRILEIKIPEPGNEYSKKSDTQILIKERLSFPFWFFAFLLFCLERYLSLIKRREATNE